MSATPTAPAAAPATSAPASTPSTPSASSVSSSNAPSTAPRNPQGLPPGDMPASKEPSNSAPNDAAPDSQASDAKIAEKAAEELRKFKLKVNGREQEVDEATLIRKAQMAEAADERFKEASAIRKQTEQFLAALRADPIKVLSHPDLGIDFRALAEQHLTEQLKKELMPPEQRELEELREFRRQAESEREQAEQEQMTQRQQAELHELQARQAREYDMQITEALSKSELPKTPQTIKRVVEVMQNALANGYDLDVPTAVDIVREGYIGDVQALVGHLDGEALLKALGDGIVGKLRKHDLANLRRKLEGQQQAPTPTAATPRTPAAKNTEPKKLNTHDWLATVRAKAGV